MRPVRFRIAIFVAFLAFASVPAFAAESPDDAKLAFFEKKIRPMLVGHCFACHSAATKPEGGLRVDDINGLLSGGNTGPAVVPGKAAKSPLVGRSLASQVKRRMPLEGNHLTDEQIADLSKWIDDGATWPALKVPASVGRVRPEYETLKGNHWAWQSLSTPKTPTPKNADWARSDVDRWILARLEAENLAPVADADRVSLVRRVTFDLTGLPASPAEVDAFIADASPGAFAAVVDRLLASKAFGERWGRHWLDVARYGESTGPSRNIPYPHAWKYRDYAIDAFNADVPFDRFLSEQIAGDLLPGDTPAEKDRLRTATGFLALGVKDVNQRFKVRFAMDNVDEQIDVVTRSALGLTASCARCHDHKFDPIPQTDYYALAGIFTSTDNAAGVRNKMGGGGLDYYDPSMLLPLSTAGPPVDPKKAAALGADLKVAKAAWDKIRGTPEGVKNAANGQPTQRPFRLNYERLQSDYNALTDPAARGHAVHGVRDAKVVADTELRIRGEAEKLGPVVPRGFLTAFKVEGAPKIDAKGSGRLELARWLTSANNPLTARVYANRVWAHLFGRGLVSTVDNFGVSGDVPTHPELLDYLALQLVREGWSTKRLIRSLVLTRAYQLGTTATAVHRQTDPANKLVWRHTSRRLDAEEIRDTVLWSAGRLDATRPTATPTQLLRMIEIRDNGPEAKTVNEKADASRFRSVYLPLLRGLTPHDLEAFDPVEQTLVTGSRDATNVPGQALFLLNSGFVRRQSLVLAERLLAQQISDRSRIEAGYRRVLGRVPSESEVERALAFVSAYSTEWVAPKPIAVAVAPASKKADAPPPFDPDQVDQTGEAVAVEVVRPKDATHAAWQAWVQALFASAEFRYLR